MVKLCSCKVSDVVEPQTAAPTASSSPKSSPMDGDKVPGSSPEASSSNGDGNKPSIPSTADSKDHVTEGGKLARQRSQMSARNLTPTYTGRLEAEAQEAAGSAAGARLEGAVPVPDARQSSKLGEAVRGRGEKKQLEYQVGAPDWWRKIPVPITGTVTMQPGKFNSVQLSSVTPSPLQYVGLNVLHSVARELSLDVSKLEKFMFEVEALMPKSNAYHNAVHVSDVVQLMYLQTLEGGPLEAVCKDPVVKLSALLAAIVHDLKHPGRTNNFLKQTSDPIIEEYGTAEQMHMALSEEIIDRLRLLEPLGEATTKRVLGLMRDTVLATNMARHMDIIKLEVPEETEAHISFMLMFAMKVSDLSHCIRNFKIHVLFTDRLKEEFYHQGDVEKALNLNVSMGMDRSEDFVEVARSQVGFLSSFIAPLFDTWAAHSDNCRLVLHLQELLWRNIDTWSMLGLKPSGPTYSDQLVAVRRKAVTERNSQLGKQLSMNDREALQIAVQQTMYGMLEMRRGTDPLEVGRESMKSYQRMQSENEMRFRRNTAHSDGSMLSKIKDVEE